MMNDFEKCVNRLESHAEKYALREKLFGTEDVLPMWVADMDIVTPPFVTKAVQRRAEHTIYGYEEMPESAYEAQMAWMKYRHEVSIEREWMFYSPSVVATINLAIQAFTEPGDGVIVQPPVYPPFMGSVTNNGRCIVRNPLRRDEFGEYRFDFDDLKKKIDKKTKLLLLCSPHNPVGRVWTKGELSELAEICLEHGIKVLSDEIHSDLVFAPHRHVPFVTLGDAAKNIAVTAIGPGKTFNVAGLAISTAVIADEGMRERFNEVYESIHFAQGTIFGHAGFEAAYRRGDEWVDALLQHLRENVEKLEKLAMRHADKISLKIPEGTYLAWIDCEKMGLGDKQLRRFFIEKAKLGLSPGISFGKEGHKFMRLNFAVPGSVMDEAISRLEKALTSEAVLSI